MLNKTYNLQVPSEPALDWDTYSHAVHEELDRLLISGDCDEKRYQQLLERNPSLLPWAYGTFGGGHHGLIHGTIISQPRLVGLVGRQPDFMYIARDSASVYAVLVEIESPCKRWFTAKGQPDAKLTQAITQLRQWKWWFQQPGNEAKFLHEYQVPINFQEHRRFEQRYILIYGRRAPLEASGYADHRSQHQMNDERFVSYDHLTPAHELRNALTAKVDARGYRAISVPPTIKPGPFTATDHVVVRGKEAASREHPMMHAQRASFLEGRWSYWDKWAKAPGMKFSSIHDCE